MLTKQDLGSLIVNCLKQNNGKATIIEVSKYIWENYEDKLRSSGNLFYTWQYDYRWQATELRKQGILKDSTISPSGVWELA
ncbi:hypothetical protein [Paenibacillus popilliae]|uniref:Restriction system protein Mrr-like N-terminal domain-containing protein n=1 Tax=Paenibacillus popilliae TaxID=78057 RepID=A0ABY3AHJ7_PAEPP|nr:hypothetical protein [Paenibacillus sp. SDF0028]TQR41155.1 hypothetical protein C7Y44_26285 [Paenibacillus sp. SDF0028]